MFSLACDTLVSSVEGFGSADVLSISVIIAER
jgi:hypothetical protein